MKATIIFNVDDNFKPGICEKCPIAKTENIPTKDGVITHNHCILMKTKKNCPIKIAVS